MKDLFTSSSYVLIISHQGPDGDSIGSSVALARYLKKLNVKSHIIFPDPFPSYYDWLLEGEDFTVANLDSERLSSLFDKGDLICCLDFNHLYRCGDILHPLVKKHETNTLVIDHHTYPEHFSKYEFIDDSASSTCELIYRLVQESKDLDLIDQSISEAIYTGLVTDTGSFKFSSTSSYTHQVASQLMKTSFNHTRIQQRISDENSISRLHLLGYALQKIVVNTELSLAYLLLTDKELKRFDFKKGDTEGFVNYVLSIKDVEVAVFVREDESIFKFSFRSKGKIKVNDFAKFYYNGGGHENAAGGSARLMNHEKITQELIENFKKYCQGQ